ncbi:MAG: DUF4249 domain-containing protein [Bacteroidales bacterium]|jgi:hypothetical protein|nr:DUF4249 domain-containing protein [Bacteroidales bacterium]
MSIKNLTSKVPILCLCLFLYSCIDEFTAKGIEEISDILVVDGIITNDETIITLNRSVKLNDVFVYPDYVRNAEVYVEREDGTLFGKEPSVSGHSDGRYIIKTGTLDINYRYRLKIKIEEHEYLSDYSYLIQTPEIDEIFWVKEHQGEPVVIYVSTSDPNNYRWSYQEVWEVFADYKADEVPFRCWSSASNNSGIIIGSAVRPGAERLAHPITEILPTDIKLVQVYRITVMQNAISKRAYTYFENIKKNVEVSNSIFAPIPSELRGNIICITDPRRPVIGYIDASSTTKKHFFIQRSDGAYELVPTLRCTLFEAADLEDLHGPDWRDLVPNKYVLVTEFPPYFFKYRDDGTISYYTYRECADCRSRGSAIAPEGWPNQ